MSAKPKARKPFIWHNFSPSKGYRQKRPPIYRLVLVQILREPNYNRDGIAVGYRKDGAGCKDSPYFVVPGIGGNVVAWCDCLGDDFAAPGWQNQIATDIKRRKTK